MSVKLLRIDSRLVHGQITTNWVKSLNVQQVIVMSDELTPDSLQYKMMKAVVPHWLQLTVVNAEQMEFLLQEERFHELETMIVVETVEDAVRIFDLGLKLSTVNIGSLKFQLGKKMVTDAVAINQDDVQAFQKLHQKNINLEIRKVFQDKPKDLWKILQDKQFV